MKEAYDIDGLQITVFFRPGLVSVVCDGPLWQLADRRRQDDFRLLISHIQRSHQRHYAEPLLIPERSFLLEIYGHIYADYYLLRYASFFRFLLGRRLYTRFLQSCEEIDCGERVKDPNRWFWNAVSVFGPLIRPFFPKNISKKHAK